MGSRGIPRALCNLHWLQVSLRAVDKGGHFKPFSTLAEEDSACEQIANIRKLISQGSEEDMESGGSCGDEGRYGDVGIGRDPSYV